MLNKTILDKVAKFSKFPKWSVEFTPILEKHYHDKILVYRHDRLKPNNTYSVNYTNKSIRPNLIEIYFDNQPVFIKYNNKILINRIPE